MPHGLSWDENYGADGAPGGGNILVHRHRRQARRVPLHARDARARDRADRPAAAPAPASSQAHWIDAETIAWPSDLGAPAADATWQLYSSADASLAVADGEVTGGDAVDLTVVAGGLTDAAEGAFPALADYTALHVDGQDRMPWPPC